MWLIKSFFFNFLPFVLAYVFIAISPIVVYVLIKKFTKQKYSLIRSLNKWLVIYTAEYALLIFIIMKINVQRSYGLTWSLPISLVCIVVHIVLSEIFWRKRLKSVSLTLLNFLFVLGACCIIITQPQ